MQNGRWTCQNVANTIQNGRWTCPHVGNPMQNGRWTCQNVANTMQNGRWTCPHVVNPMQNGRWTCPNVANTMQNDKFKFQTVANTRQMVPAKKSKKNPKPAQKKILKLFHTQKKMANCHKHTAVETYTSMLKEMLFAGQSSCCTCFMLMKRTESRIIFSAKSLCAVKRNRHRRPESLLQ